MKKVNLLSRAEMKKVMGGTEPVDGTCDNLTGQDKALCLYNLCLAGWDTGSHEPEENTAKFEECCASSGSNYC